MRIQHNIAAINSHRNLGINNSFTNKNLEKLSSGYRINRAGDDAAGLAISEKMRGQIRGLGMAEQNTANGISLIQTAEGGLNETHAILQRMRELAVQSSNGTYQDEDRIQLTKEFTALKSEIDRIAESTQYNRIKLLDGSLGNSSARPKVVGFTDAGLGVVATDIASVKGVSTFSLPALDAGDTLNIEYTDVNGNAQVYSYTNTTNATIAAGAMLTNVQGDASEAGLALNASFDITATTFTSKVAGEGKAEINSATRTVAATGLTNSIAVTQTTPGKNEGMNLVLTTVDTFTIDGRSFQIVTDASELKSGNTAIFVNADATETNSIAQQLKDMGYNAQVGTAAGSIDIFAGGSKGLVFQIGANGGADQRVSLNVNSMSSSSIGITTNGVGYEKLTGASLASASIATIEEANYAIEIISGASDMVSTQRAGLGALQNRLESTMNSLGVAKENLTAAESVIRDVDMAKEMMEFTKNQILVQASQAMLAQANQLPQGVLSLLR